MSATQAPVNEGARLFEELLAVHGIMTRGAGLVAESFTRLASGAAVDTATLASTAQWLVAFVHHHHKSEDDLLWPVLRERFPEAVGRLDSLTEEHEVLDVELDKLAKVIEQLTKEPAGSGSVAWGQAMSEGTKSSHRIRDVLVTHLAAEEPVLKELFPAVPDPDVVRLRKAVTDGAPRSGPHLVFGFLEFPGPVPGRDHMYANFPAPVRWARRLLMNKFRKTLMALAYN
ncbi:MULTISPECIES: hemerythrin domain-containing protein [Streptomyces]|uniref:Hemerythrin-like domain-containing protein n=1 Tax=Streptomyces canarius TaxID=285453 RepID=A0ABQ3DEB8_9ACTN|nr:hemerythrin domain-containing protein [Streptomyces canarius]GHA78070.1 hypothetical protein GCM10010345_94420 [Streptomyces canarius]